MAAGGLYAVRTRNQDGLDLGTVLRQTNAHLFARQGQGHEDRPSRETVALAAYGVDGQVADETSVQACHEHSSPKAAAAGEGGVPS
jgi:hypothetical protein